MSRKNSVFMLAAVASWVGCGGSPPAETGQEPVAPAFFAVDPATAGTISGKVVYSGSKPAPKRIEMTEEAACVRLHPRGLFDEEIVLNADGTLANVFVYIKAGLEDKRFAPDEEPVVVDQKGCRFDPHVIGIRTMQPFHVTNSDPVSHNIHPMPAVNREWNQGQAPGAAALEREFARSEIMIPVKCNVHAWMRSYINVVEHPYFAVARESGTFELKSVPPGRYTIEAVHAKLGKLEQAVELEPSGRGAIEFSFKAE